MRRIEKRGKWDKAKKLSIKRSKHGQSASVEREANSVGKKGRFAFEAIRKDKLQEISNLSKAIRKDKLLS